MYLKPESAHISQKCPRACGLYFTHIYKVFHEIGYDMLVNTLIVYETITSILIRIQVMSNTRSILIVLIISTSSR